MINMIHYITIESWIATKRIQSNKPNKRQKLLAWLKLKPLPEPKYWHEADITISYPHPLKCGDTILTTCLHQYFVIGKLQSSALRTETFRISSIKPTKKLLLKIGQSVILGSCCSERDTNIQPYGGQII